MPAENFEEEGLAKIPNLELANLKFRLSTTKYVDDSTTKDVDDEKIKAELFEAIKAGSTYSRDMPSHCKR